MRPRGSIFSDRRKLSSASLFDLHRKGKQIPVYVPIYPEETCNGLRQIKKSFPNLIPHKMQYINGYICKCLALFFILVFIRLPEYHILQFQSFFNPDSTATYLGDTPNVPQLMVGHSYWTNTPLNNLHDIRCQLKDTLDKYKVDFWQTETCIMGNDEEIGGGGGYDFTMKTALYVARIIHHDIVYAGARSWQWWRSIGGDYKDGLIREYSDPTFLNGEVKDSKLMWALGNYSRFIRPGAVRKAIIAKDNQGKIIPEGDTDVTGLMCSAYQNTDGKEVFVMINYAAEDKEFTFYQRNGIIKNWTIYRTSDKDGENLLPVGSIKNHEKVVIPARSIITLVTQ